MAIVSDLSGNSGNHNSTPVVDQHMSHTIDAVNKSYAVVPSDTVDLPNGVTEALIVAVAGAVKVTYPNGVIDTIGVAVGVNRVRVKRVWATGTTATGISAAS